MNKPLSMEQASLLEANSASIFYADSKLCLQNDFTSSEVAYIYLPQYETDFFLSNSGWMVQNKHSPARRMEKAPHRQKFHSRTDTRPLFTENKVKRELFPGTVSQVLADVNKLRDLSVTEAGGLPGSPGPKYMLSGRIEDDLFIPLPNNCFLPNIVVSENSPQIVPDKENDVNGSLLRLFNRQKILLDRAHRSKRRLQLFLGRHAAEHCHQQIGDFLKHQTKKAKSSCESIDQLVGGDRTHISAVDALSINSDTTSQVKETCQVTSPAVRQFSAHIKGIINSVEQGLDSDATGSSSDEDWDEESRKTHDCPEYNWLSMRAHVGSRCTWLEAQILELDSKIQQLTDLQAQIHSKKGTLLFEEPPDCREGTQLQVPGSLLWPAGRLATPRKETNPSPAKDFEMSPSSPTRLLRNIEKQSAQLTEMFSNVMTTLPVILPPSSQMKSHTCENKMRRFSDRFSGGYRADVPIVNVRNRQQPMRKRKKICTKARSTSRTGAARVKPLQLYQKRDLYRLPSECNALHSHEAVYCDESLQTSDYSSTWISIKPQGAVLVRNNVCEIDPHFHPVLSLPSDIPLSLHFGSLLKNNSEISRNVVSSTLFTPEDTECNGHDIPLSLQFGTTNGEISRNVVSSTLFTPEDSKCNGDACLHTTDAMTIDCNNKTEQIEDIITKPQTSLKSSSQTHDASNGTNGTRRRLRSESSYDIDNIVIPMNLVAPIKLEKLQYKEIITPSWKELVYGPLKVSHNEVLEDLSDEAYARRHEKDEQREKRLWSFWHLNKWPKKSRSSCHRFSAWSENDFPCNEENCSPNCLSLISCDTPSPNGNSQSPAELELYKVEPWECRAFPLIGADARLLNLHRHNCLLTQRPPVHVNGKETSVNNK
ncbi:KAT8 regulatory NSL complex subunit 1-like protein isoform X2 [Hyperolius riggenbachi]|uniref:KAT8 regulatory NSL complex subunit 1-like protein isoform X2 n=1 Tax=Hyperolius riggenbachi TaxID=752182 RepID=UPI0035A27D39